MSKRIFTIAVLLLVLLVIGLVVLYNVFQKMGTNFVHGPNDQYDYAERLKLRVTFPIKSYTVNFNAELNRFLKENSKYQPTDSVMKLAETDCDCYINRKLIFFKEEPSESYLITYDTGTIKTGAIDQIFQSKGSMLIKTRTSDLDSTQKERIRNRLLTEIIYKVDN